MSTVGTVVVGEAPESDSEEEINTSSGGNSANIITVAKGRVIAGEAPESDDETIGHSGSIDSISSAASALSISAPSDQKKKWIKKNGSLLTKKLCEKNISLAKNVNDLLAQTVASAHNELNTTDQMLLQCQMQLQEAEKIYRTLNSQVSQLDSKLQALLTSPFIPVITIPNKEPVAGI